MTGTATVTRVSDTRHNADGCLQSLTGSELISCAYGDVIVWRDAHHLTATYVRTLTPRLEAEITPLLN